MICIKTIIVAALIAVASIASSAQNNCSKPGGDEMKIYVRNATEKSIVVNFVDENCKESASN